MDTTTLPATRRTHLGSKHTRRVRQRGQIPAIIYGHKETPEPIALDAHEVENVLHHHSRVLSLELDGNTGQYLIKSVQYDHLDTTPIHLDLMRVDKDERVQVTVEVELRGTPRGAGDGGVLTQVLNEVHVECIMTAIPEVIRVGIVGLGIGESLLVKDLKVPEGVTLLEAPEDTVAICRVPSAAETGEPAGEEEEPEAGKAEPEVIGRGKEEGSDEEGG